MRNPLARLMHWCRACVFSAGVLVVFAPVWLVMYWGLWDTATPLIASPYQVQNTQAGSLVLTRLLCFSRPTRGEVRASFVDGVMFTVPPQKVVFPAGCHSWQGRLRIPHSLPVGVYHYRVTLHLRVNPIVSVDVPLPAIPVTVGSVDAARAGAALRNDAGPADGAFPTAQDISKG